MRVARKRLIFEAWQYKGTWDPPESWPLKLESKKPFVAQAKWGEHGTLYIPKHAWVIYAEREDIMQVMRSDEFVETYEEIK